MTPEIAAIRQRAEKTLTAYRDRKPPGLIGELCGDLAYLMRLVDDLNEKNRTTEMAWRERFEFEEAARQEAEAALKQARHVIAELERCPPVKVAIRADEERRRRRNLARAYLKSIHDGLPFKQSTPELTTAMMRMGLIVLVPDESLPMEPCEPLPKLKLALTELGLAIHTVCVRRDSLLGKAWSEWLETGKAPNLQICGLRQPAWSRRAAELLAEPKGPKNVRVFFHRDELKADGAHADASRAITPLSCEVSEKPRLTDDGSRIMGTEVTMTITGILGDDGPQNCPEEQPTLFSGDDCCPTCNDCGKLPSGCACKPSAPECVCPQGHHGIHDPGCAWKRWKDQGCTT